MVRRFLATLCFIAALCGVLAVSFSLEEPLTIAHDFWPDASAEMPQRVGWSVTWLEHALWVKWSSDAPYNRANVRVEWVPGGLELAFDVPIMQESEIAVPPSMPDDPPKPGPFMLIPDSWNTSARIEYRRYGDDGSYSVMTALLGVEHALRLSAWWVPALFLLLWCLLVSPAVIRFVRRRRRRKRGECLECGYSLRGLPEPRCPECGAVGARAVPKAAAG